MRHTFEIIVPRAPVPAPIVQPLVAATATSSGDPVPCARRRSNTFQSSGKERRHSSGATAETYDSDSDSDEWWGDEDDDDDGNTTNGASGATVATAATAAQQQQQPQAIKIALRSSNQLHVVETSDNTELLEGLREQVGLATQKQVYNSSFYYEMVRGGGGGVCMWRGGGGVCVCVWGGVNSYTYTPAGIHDGICTHTRMHSLAE